MNYFTINKDSRGDLRISMVAFPFTNTSTTLESILLSQLINDLIRHILVESKEIGRLKNSKVKTAASTKVNRSRVLRVLLEGCIEIYPGLKELLVGPLNNRGGQRQTIWDFW